MANMRELPCRVNKSRFQPGFCTTDIPKIENPCPPILLIEGVAAVSPLEESPESRPDAEPPPYINRDFPPISIHGQPSIHPPITSSRRRRRTLNRDDRESFNFAQQVKARRRQIMEQRSSMMSGEFDEEVDWSKYDPPEALSKLPGLTSETVLAVVQSALENVKTQIHAEKVRAEERQHAIQEEAESEAAAAAIDEAEEVDRKGKGKEVERFDSAISISEPVDHAANLPTPRNSRDFTLRQPLPLPKRSRFGGITRILRHVRGNSESKSEGSAGASASSSRHSHSLAFIPLHTRVTNGTHTPPVPTPFTHFVYKQTKPSASSSSQKRKEEVVECVSCLDDIPAKSAIKTVCHHYCADCFLRLIQTAVDNEAQWPPKCCLNTIPLRTIKKHAPRALLASYHLKDEEFKTPVERRLYCSQPDCGLWIRQDRVDLALRTATCASGHVVCTMCRGPSHPAEEACPQDRDTLLADRLAEEEGWRRCNRCHVLVEHKEACQHMTCRCGAEFCYVCGLTWRSCACTLEQLNEIKERAARRRAERTAEEEAEARELAAALRLVEEFEREEARKDELRREEARRKRKERRRREAEERARREQERRVELDKKYEDLRGSLMRIEGVQRMVLEYSHDRAVEAAGEKAKKEREDLVVKQETQRTGLRAETDAKLKELEMGFYAEYRVRVDWERRLESEFATAQSLFWADVIGGQSKLQAAMKAYMLKNDERMDAWMKWRDREMEKARYLAEDEVAIREELMEEAKRRLEERLEQEQVEAGRRLRAEGRWFELVVEERKRLLVEVEMVERENGGEEGEGSGDGESEMEWETDDEVDYVSAIEVLL
ncbi:hypothetical protein GE09DRAFT_1288029 [Coniochaeta sp. 2T2.1]|nr:hypothetical protein GE09DRAFT_1288029 [Coniochaeta sp. 2T2.1]